MSSDCEIMIGMQNILHHDNIIEWTKYANVSTVLHLGPFNT